MAKYSPFKNQLLWKDSALVAFALLGGIDLFMSVSAISLDFIDAWWLRLVAIIGAYLFLFALTLFAKAYRAKNDVSLEIRGMKVTIKEGDLFKADGWKVIPFNENFDTRVDDVVIAHNSLNGAFIDSLQDDEKENLKLAISTDSSSPLQCSRSSDGYKKVHQLGTIKTFKDFMLLALTHFNEQNEGETCQAEYENTLRTMWREIGRAYAGKQINLPLVGGGITRFVDLPEKSNEQLLRCILCTLRTSTVTFAAPITIYLSKNALETISLYEMKGAR